MRILLLAPVYMDLHLPIMNEMSRQGHEVTFMEDVMFSWDWRYPWRGWRDKTCRRMNFFIRKTFQNYWKEVLNSKPELHYTFDYFIVINGCSFHPCLLKSLRKESPGLKTALYLWDNSSFYDYYHYATCFDRVMTYDIDDSHKYNVKFLPFYWQHIPADLLKLPIRYKLSMIGSNHDGRYRIAKSIDRQLDTAIGG